MGLFFTRAPKPLHWCTALLLGHTQYVIIVYISLSLLSQQGDGFNHYKVRARMAVMEKNLTLAESVYLEQVRKYNHGGSCLKHCCLERTPSQKGQNPTEQPLGMYLILSLTKDTSLIRTKLFGKRGVLIRGGVVHYGSLCSCLLHMHVIPLLCNRCLVESVLSCKDRKPPDGPLLVLP